MFHSILCGQPPTSNTFGTQQIPSKAYSTRTRATATSQTDHSVSFDGFFAFGSFNGSPQSLIFRKSIQNSTLTRTKAKQTQQPSSFSVLNHSFQIHTSKMNSFLYVCLMIATAASIHGTCGLQLSMVASRTPFQKSRGQTLERNIPFSKPTTTTRSSPSSSVTSNFISQLACMALKRRLEDQKHVSCDLTAESNNLLFGKVGPVTVKGRGWRSPLGLTCRAIEATVNVCTLDMGKVISNQKLVLTTPGAYLRALLEERKNRHSFEWGYRHMHP